MENITIEVQGHFGPKQITRAEFVKRWAETVGEASWLAHSEADMRAVERMRKDIERLAGKEFDRLAKVQGKA